jgi:hypothetical protein
MIKLFLTIIASILLLMGLISMVTPIPGGTFMIAGSITILICSSPTVQSWIKSCRARANWFNKMFTWLETKIGSRIHFVGDALQRTRPDSMVESESS